MCSSCCSSSQPRSRSGSCPGRAPRPSSSSVRCSGRCRCSCAVGSPSRHRSSLSLCRQARPSLDPTLGAETTAFLALLLAFWVVGAYNERTQAIAGAAIGFASIAVVARVDERLGLEEAVSGILFGGVVSLIAYALQRRGRRTAELEERAARLEREREEAERAAVAEERRRIARELHDVIAHSITLMTVQAGAARLLLSEDPGRAREPILSVEETGRHALAELRRLLGILRADERRGVTRAPAWPRPSRRPPRRGAWGRATGRARRRG